MKNSYVTSVHSRSRAMVLVSLLFALLPVVPASYAGEGDPGTNNACISVGKTCNTVPIGLPNTVTAGVTNCGDVPIFNIQVNDNVYGLIGTIPGLPPGGSFTLTKLVMNTCGFFPNVVVASGTAGTSDGPVPVQASANAACQVTENPCISVRKTCPTVNVGQPNLVVAAVTNCGNVTLTNIAVTDDLYGSMPSIVALDPGGFANVAKVVTNATCGDLTNVVTVSGQSVCGTPVQAQASAVCSVTGNPCISVHKSCPTVNVGQPNLVVAAVTNCGNIRLVNITVTDDLYGSMPSIVALDPGGFANVAKVVTNATCGDLTNVVTASGESVCGTVQASASAICSVTCSGPRLCVTKEVAVFDSNNECSEAWSHLVVVANGQTNGSCPSFCYRVTVRNCGSDVLTNVTVSDDVLDLSASCSFPTTLAVGQAVTCIIADVSHCCTVTNTVTASGTGVFSGDSTNASATAAVVVEDHQAPVVECVPGVNPSGKKIPVAGKNPASGQNPDGYYQLLARDNCDSNPDIYLMDSGSSFIAGPFTNGVVIKLTQSPGKTPSQDPAPAPIAAHLHFKGDGLLFAMDANGNASEPVLCLVPRHPK